MKRLVRLAAAPVSTRAARWCSAASEELSIDFDPIDSDARAVYLDAQATQPLDPRVLDAMMPFQLDQFGNPHSRTHEYGWKAEEATEKAREQVCALRVPPPNDICFATHTTPFALPPPFTQVKELIGARQSREIVFTSGATESNNIAVKGAARFWKVHASHPLTYFIACHQRLCHPPPTTRHPPPSPAPQQTKNHVITLQTEHKCVLESCRSLEGDGFEVTYLPVQQDGTVDLAQLEAAMRPETSLVSIMAVNNEIGVIQPLEEIGRLCRERKITFHTGMANRRTVPTFISQHMHTTRTLFPHRRRRASHRQDPHRCGEDEHRPDVDFGTQDLRPEGHGCAVRAQSMSQQTTLQQQQQHTNTEAEGEADQPP